MVLIIGTALSIGTFSALQLVMTEKRLNRKSYVYHEARQGAEALIQSAFADLHSRFTTSSSFPTDSLSPSKNPLGISDDFVSIYTASDANSNLVIPSEGSRTYDSLDDYGTEYTEIIGGEIPPGEWRFINPDAPGNEFDEMKGSMVFVRGVEILSKATARNEVWGEATAYCRQILEVRDAPLFAYAIFYNLPMEIAPGPEMNVYGPVHANNDIWVQSGNGLNFHDKMTIAGDLHHGRHPDSGKSDSQGDVQLVNSQGDMVSLQENTTWDSDSRALFSGDWLESDSSGIADQTSFSDLVTNLWGGNLQTGDHGVNTQNPVGVADYVEDSDTTTAAKESLNSAYNILQPTLNRTTIDAVSDETQKASLEAIETEKYSYKAGLTIRVDSSGTISYYTYDRDVNGALQYDDDGNPQTVALQPKTALANSKEFSSYVDENTGNEVITSGMHDARMEQDLDMVELDMQALTTAIHNDSADDWHDGSKPSDWWNGVVYVEFPQQELESSRTDYVNPAKSGWGLKLVNGDVIPNPNFGHSQDVYGTSVATNQMMYIQGDYNSDGSTDTGSPTQADDSTTFGQQQQEAPAALIADSITFLSDNWDDSKSSQGGRNASDTEVSAAIMTGLVPSGETGSNSYSGGVENFPRFLESWSDDTLTMRGSIVALFESEVATERWGKGGVYSAPKREWGFHEKFSEGFLPPGTPNSRGFRGRDFTDLTASEYASHIARIKSSLSE